MSLILAQDSPPSPMLHLWLLTLTLRSLPRVLPVRQGLSPASTPTSFISRTVGAPTSSTRRSLLTCSKHPSNLDPLLQVLTLTSGPSFNVSLLALLLPHLLWECLSSLPSAPFRIPNFPSSEVHISPLSEVTETKNSLETKKSLILNCHLEGASFWLRHFTDALPCTGERTVAQGEPVWTLKPGRLGIKSRISRPA